MPLIEVPALLNRILAGGALALEEAQALMERIMAGTLTPAQIAALAIALRAKGETEDEIIGFVQAMRGGAVPLPHTFSDVVDTCGTGGDYLQTLNVSTAAALVAAGAGVRVAKHGNRAASSKSGSADVLEALGVTLNAPPQIEERALSEAGIAFLFARSHHPALTHAAAVRKDIGIRTVFNLLGPLTNPAGVRIQLLGVFPGIETRKVAGVLQRLGALRAMVVRGLDGMDEITLTAPTEISELNGADIRTFHVTPEEFGLAPCTLDDLAGGDAAANAAAIRAILAGARGPKTDIVLLNAAAVIYLAGRAESHQAGIAVARQAIASGAAERTLKLLVEITSAARG